MKEPTLLGRWHHGNGVLCCGTLRIASANFDTNPTKEIQNAVFQDICDTMNTRTEQYEMYKDRAIPRCACCGTTENLHFDGGSGGPYRCDSPDCMVF